MSLSDQNSVRPKLVETYRDLCTIGKFLIQCRRRRWGGAMARRDFRQLGLADSIVRRRGKKSEWLDRLGGRARLAGPGNDRRGRLRQARGRAGLPAADPRQAAAAPAMVRPVGRTAGGG